MSALLKLPVKNWSYQTAFSRNKGLISAEEQEVLRNSRVAIPGMGGVGGSHLMTLVRMGIGKFNIADADTFDTANFNRQYGANVTTIGVEKSDAMAKMALEVNPELELRTWKCFIDESNVDEFLKDVDLVIDSVDAFVIDARLLIFERAHEKGIPVISAGPLGFSASMIVQTSEGPSLSKYLCISPYMSETEKFARFIAGLAPQPWFLRYLNTKDIDEEQQRGPSIAAAINLCSGFASCEAIKLLLGRGKTRGLPHYHYYDGFLGKFKKGKLRWGNKGPVQRLLIWALQKFAL